MSESEGQLQDYSVDQAAGAIVLVLGAIAGLLQVIWLSKCHCKVNLCYIFRCERRPPTEEEMKTLKAKVNQEKDKKELKKQDDKEKKGPEGLKPTTSTTSTAADGAAEPEPEIDNLV